MSDHAQVPVHELDLYAALAFLRDELQPDRATEESPLAAAAGRVLARALVSPRDLPAFTNSAMDGYAVRAADCGDSTRLQVVGTARAGHPFLAPLARGQAVRIMTGAPIPDGADAVVLLEEVRAEGDAVSFRVPVRPGLNVRPLGEHVHAGDVVLETGTLLGAPEIGMAAAIGAARLDVFRRLRVGVGSTGDELTDPPAAPARAGSFDANRPLLLQACRSAGFEPLDLGICADSAARFDRFVENAAAAGVDALVVSGGSALGDADVVRQAGAIRFLPLNIRPGRGITFGTLETTRGRMPVFGMPGNVVAAFVMFHLLAMPALRHLSGGQARVPAHLPIPLAVDIEAKPGRIDYRRGRFVTDSSGGLSVEPLAQQGSAMLRTLVQADVLMAVGPQARYGAGESIPVVPLAGLPH
jgi:molybdopterin molybdotransferase